MCYLLPSIPFYIGLSTVHQPETLSSCDIGYCPELLDHIFYYNLLVDVEATSLPGKEAGTTLH